MKVRRISAIEPKIRTEGVIWLDISTEDDQMGFTTHEIRLEPNRSFSLDKGLNFNHAYFYLEGSCDVILPHLPVYKMQKKSVIAVPKGTISEIRSSTESVRLVIFLTPTINSQPSKPQPKFQRCEDIQGTEYDVNWGHGQSRRYLTKADGFGMTVTNTLIDANVTISLQYTNHVELCYYFEGCINYLWDGGEQHAGIRQETVEQGDGLIILLDKHDKHTAQTLDLPAEAVCGFYPALTGNEVHRFDSEGYSTYQ